MMHEVKNINLQSKSSDIRSIVHLITLHGKELIGMELGVSAGHSFCTLLKHCKNIKKLYGVDNYKPYKDYLKHPYNQKPAYEVTQSEIEKIEQFARYTISNSDHSSKAELLKMDAVDALSRFSPDSLDFIFIDTYMTYDQAKEEINSWYQKVKPGGIFSGHDWSCVVIQKAVLDFRKRNNINQTLSTFDNTWVWYK